MSKDITHKYPEKWIYLSPHLDDAVLSCGGLISEQVKKGLHVQIWTIFAGDPPAGELTPFARSLHQRWQMERNAYAMRRLEDLNACKRLGADAVHLKFSECIYRLIPGTHTPIILENEDLFKPLNPGEMPLVNLVHQAIAPLIPPGATLVLPLTVGDHIDHQITRLAGEPIQSTKCYYAEYPYISREGVSFDQKLNPDLNKTHFEVGVDSLLAWQESVAEHKTQLSTFWEDIPSMYSAIHEYWLAGGGTFLWCPD